MSSQAKVNANRRNAGKSTGPRTPEGKAIVAQNAVKHGLRARTAVIKDEDPAEFELYRQGMLDALAPADRSQLTLAERIVNLAWRLKRAERMQDEALDYLIESDHCDSWSDHLRSMHEPAARADLTFGRVVARDFAHAMVLDRLTLYERRIESSLCRMMNELRLARKQRPLGNAECGVRNAESRAREGFAAPETAGANLVKQSQLPAEGQSVLSVETQYLASPPAETETQASTAERVPSTCQTKPTETGGSVCSVPEIVGAGFKPARTAFPETQNVASLQDAERVKQSQSVATVPSPCETKPTEAAGAVCRVPARISRALRRHYERGGFCQTKPIDGWCAVRNRAN